MMHRVGVTGGMGRLNHPISGPNRIAVKEKGDSTGLPDWRKTMNVAATYALRALPTL